MCGIHALQIDVLLACGGLSKNSLFIQEHADIIGTLLFLYCEDIIQGCYHANIPTIYMDYLSLNSCISVL